MKHFLTSILVLAFTTSVHAQSTMTVSILDKSYQTITGFGAACCDGAMCPFGSDTKPVTLLYGPQSKIGLNIMRMEISPNFKGDITAADVGWDTPYDWNGSLPSAKIVKQRGGIVFGTPWSPPGEYKTNGTAQGGNAENQGYQKGKLREDCYEKFFPWLNTFLAWMKSKGVAVDAVSIQNEPDWWVSYSGCLYDPQDLVKLVKNYAYMLDREKYPGVKLISGEPLGFTKNYTDPLMQDETCREQIDIVAGHLYGHSPHDYMKPAAVLPTQYGKEVWMTEHSVTDNVDRLPNWHEQLLFAEEVNECMQCGCTGYIYWYMRAHWAFVGTGETKYGTGNKKNQLLPRAYVMSHFSKYVTGATRVGISAAGFTEGTEKPREATAYVKGDSLILIAIDTTKNAFNLNLRLPFKVKSGTHILSTGNETANLCQQSEITIEEPTQQLLVNMPARSLNTYVFLRYREDETSVQDPKITERESMKPGYYDLQGRRLDGPRGLCIERRADGSTHKVYIPE